MRAETLAEDIATVTNFPKGKNVRIKIEGLAVCRFDDNTSLPETQSKCNFLQHIDYHILKFSIVRIDPSGTVTIIKPVTDIGADTKTVTITGKDLDRPASYIHQPQAGEFDLDKLLNLSELHKEQFKPVNLHPTTEISIKNCSFYTYKTTGKNYIVKLNNAEIKPAGNLCEIIGGYLNCSSGTVDIDIPEAYSAKLPVEENGISYKYEIAFSNHCHGTTQQCLQALGSHGGSDVKFLYDILEPSKKDNEKIELVEDGIQTETINVAACLPVETEPCAGCN